VSAIVLAADGAELIGRCYRGDQGKEDATKRLRDGLKYLRSIDPEPGLIDGHRLPPDLVDRIIAQRLFGAHGAAYDQKYHGKGVILDQMITKWLLRGLARALNEFWKPEGSRERHKLFARAAIQPLYVFLSTGREPVFVRGIQTHLQAGRQPGEQIPHEEAWRAPGETRTSGHLPPGTHIIPLDTTNEGGASAIP